MNFKWLFTYLSLAHALPYHVIQTLVHHILLPNDRFLDGIRITIVRRCEDLKIPLYGYKKRENPYPLLIRSKKFAFMMLDD